MEKSVNLRKLEWLNQPKQFILKRDYVIIETEPYTNLITNGRSEEAKELMLTPKGSFCFTVRADFSYHKEFDQCGVVIYVNDERKAVAGILKRDGEISKLQCIVYYPEGGDCSDRDIGSGIQWMYYRIWYRTGGFRIQYSFNGKRYSDLRKFAVEEDSALQIGIYACSPSDSKFDCEFSKMTLSEEE